jgi:TonB family protein
MPLLLGGAALVFAGLGAGYFFMHRGTTPRPTPSVTEASQPSASPTSTSRGLLIAPNQQPAVEPAPPQTAQPISTVATGSAGVAGTSPSDSQNVRQRANGLDAKQPDRAMARRQPIPNLKMSSPTNASKTLAKLPDGPSMGSEDLALSVAPGESSSPNFAVRAANQPAAPPDPLAAISSATSAKTSQDAKLISSTRPVYPAVAKESNIQGRVAINATIDEVGNVVGAKAVSGPMSLRQAAVDAVTHWKYSPARIGGKPASSQITISLDFRLN